MSSSWIMVAETTDDCAREKARRGNCSYSRDEFAPICCVNSLHLASRVDSVPRRQHTALTPVRPMASITQTQLFIDGKFSPASSGRTFLNINPATAHPIAEVHEASQDDVDRAVAAARKALNG